MARFNLRSLMIGAVGATMAMNAGASAWAAESRASMMLGHKAAAPAGYVTFCERQPSECYGSGQPNAAPLPVQVALNETQPSAWEAAFAQARGQREMATGAVSRGPFWARFSPQVGKQSYFDAGSRDDGKDVADAQQVETTILEMTRANRKLLQRINERVNVAIRPATDEQIYGAWDVWAEPLLNRTSANRDVYGDCEDYVLEKRRALIEAGVPRAALSIAVARIPSGESHAVLLIATDKGDYVMDNLTPWVNRWSDVSYGWVMRQVNGDPDDWRWIV